MTSRTALPLRAYSCLALSMSLVGIYVGLSPLLVTVIPVMLLAWLRFGVAALAMAGWLRPVPGDAGLGRREHGLLFLQSLLGNFLFTLCALYGTWLTGAVSAGVVMATIPAAVALMSRLFLKEPLSLRIWGAIALSGAAVTVLAIARAGSGSSPAGGDTDAAVDHTLQKGIGHALLLAAVVCEASYVVIGKRLSGQVHPKRISAIINLWGLALTTPLAAGLALDFDFAQVGLPTWGLFLFYALTASVFTVWLWMRGLQEVPAQAAGIFTVLLPLSSAAVGVLVLHEPWGPAHAAALLLAVAAVALATRQPAGPGRVAPG